MSYSEELKKIKAERRKIFAIGFSLVVALPTFIAAFYYGLLAAPKYTSISKFTVTVEGGASAGAMLDGGIGALLSGGAGASNPQEAYVVQEYIESQDMVRHLKDKIDLYNIYDSEEADFWASPPSNPTIEEFTDYYNQMVHIRYEDQSGMIITEIDAFTPEDAIKISGAISDAAEKFVNERSLRIQKDSVQFAEAFLKESEEKVLEANIDLSEFRNKNKNFDPTITATGVLEITAKLEAELAETKTEIATLSNFLKSDNARIQALRAKARSLQGQISSQSSRLASKTGSTLANIAQEYEALKLLSEFSVKRYSMALAAFEEARNSARKQTKYLVRVVGPTLPEESLKPKALNEILGTFFIALVTYILGGLMISALRDHIRV